MLPLVLLSYCSAVHRSTGFTPVKVMFGAELLPADLVFWPPRNIYSTSSSQYVATLEKELQQMFDQAKDRHAASHAVQADHYNLKAHGNCFKWSVASRQLYGTSSFQ